MVDSNTASPTRTLPSTGTVDINRQEAATLKDREWRSLSRSGGRLQYRPQVKLKSRHWSFAGYGRRTLQHLWLLVWEVDVDPPFERIDQPTKLRAVFHVLLHLFQQSPQPVGP